MTTHTEPRPLVLITNDDGIFAKGISVLAHAAAKYADVVVAAPNKGYSGQSHSFSLTPLRVEPYGGIECATCHMISGSPVDCIKLSVHGLLPRKPDLVLSGINHGSNSSSSVHYSGTLGAAREAAMLGIKGIGLSMADSDEDADFGHAVGVADRIIAWALNSNLPTHAFYNVNIPKGEVKGVKVCRLANGHWNEVCQLTATDGDARIYKLNGDFINTDLQSTDTDEYWLGQGYATITPCKIDVNDYELMNSIDISNL